MTARFFMLLALWLLPQTLATVSGQILDQEAKPLAGASVTYKAIGIVDKDIQVLPGMRSETSRMLERGGRVYNTKTDKKGAFVLVGVEYGVYQIEITAPDGRHLYSGKKTIADTSDPNAQNVLNVDLSLAMSGPIVPGAGTNLAAGKKTKEQLELIRQENANAVKINRLIARYHAVVELQYWEEGINILHQLIALDTHRWEFYQNLGTLQANAGHYQEAAESFAKAVEVAEKVLANPSDTDRALTTVGDLLLAEADSYQRLERIDEAVALYDKAAAIYPHPFMAHYRACSALINNAKTDAAIEKCNQAIADDPAQWEPHQTLGGLFTAANKPKDALVAYENGIVAAQKILEQHPDSQRTRTGLGQMMNSQGNLLVQLKKYEEAIGMFTRAAELSAYPAMPYFNLCATHYNLKHSQEALAACDHAIAADSTLSDAYYIKSVILFGQARLERGRYVAPPGTAEAMNKYLENAPLGEYAGTVRQMLHQLNKPADPPLKPAKK